MNTTRIHVWSVKACNSRVRLINGTISNRCKHVIIIASRLRMILIHVQRWLIINQNYCGHDGKRKGQTFQLFPAYYCNSSVRYPVQRFIPRLSRSSASFASTQPYTTGSTSLFAQTTRLSGCLLARFAHKRPEQ